MTKDEVLKKLKLVPKKPGCYLWKNNSGEIIYIGKAKNLFNRTHQYFSNKTNNLKTMTLVDQIFDIECIVVRDENEALILESKLISKYKPQFNILLKEGHNYPYIALTNEKYPRLIYTHTYNKKFGKFYGPFATKDGNVYEIYKFLQQVFPFRKCSLKQKRKCMFYDIGQCLCPAVYKTDPKIFIDLADKLNNLFLGKVEPFKNELRNKEKLAVDRYDFESANKYQELQKNLDKFVISNKNYIVNLGIKSNVDVVGYVIKENVICVVIFSYIQGQWVNKHSDIFSFVLDYEDQLENYLIQYYQLLPKMSLPKKIVISLSKSSSDNIGKLLNSKIINFTKGKWKKIMQMTILNANQLLKSNFFSVVSKDERTIGAIVKLKSILKLKKLNEIDIFDNANLFNKNAVGVSCRFSNGLPNKNKYRKFLIKIADSNSDYWYMYEVVYRRYRRIIDKNELPDLIIVDGGKLQINAALKALKIINLNIPVIGLRKDDHHNTDVIIDSNDNVISLQKNSTEFFLLKNMQDEVHRFAITFHRKKRYDSLFFNELNVVPNLGKKRIKLLMENFNTVNEVKNASVEQLAQIIPKKIAIDIKKIFFNKKN